MLHIFFNAREAGNLYRAYVGNHKPEPFPQDHTSDGPRPVVEQPGQHVGQRELQSISHILNSSSVAEHQAQRIDSKDVQPVSDIPARAPVDFALPDSTIDAAILNVHTQDGAKPSCASINIHTNLSKAGRKRDLENVIIDLTKCDEEIASEEQRPTKKER